jgi:hypothetical protein
VAAAVEGEAAAGYPSASASASSAPSSKEIIQKKKFKASPENLLYLSFLFSLFSFFLCNERGRKT